MIKKKQNEVSWKFLEASDLGQRRQEILKDACNKTGFISEKLLTLQLRLMKSKNIMNCI